MRVPNMVGLFHGKSHLEMDDLAVPIFQENLHITLTSVVLHPVLAVNSNRNRKHPDFCSVS